MASLSEGISEVGEVLAGSVNRAVLAIVGAGYGSGSLKKYQQSVGMVFRQSVSIALVSDMIQTAVMLPMIRIMLHGESDSVRQMAVIALISSSMSLVFYLLNNVFIGTYEATGQLRFAHVNYLLDYCVFPIGLMVLLGKCFGINGVWISNPLSEALVLLFNIMIAWRACGHFPRRASDFGQLRDGQLRAKG